MIDQLNNGAHNWSLEIFLLILLGAVDVRSNERVIRGSEVEFLGPERSYGLRDIRHPDAKLFVGRVLRVLMVLQGS